MCFSYTPSLLHLHPVERSGIFVAIFHSCRFPKIVSFVNKRKGDREQGSDWLILVACQLSCLLLYAISRLLFIMLIRLGLSLCDTTCNSTLAMTRQ